MTFEENPFRVLNVSIYDTKATIIERADELSFEDPDREEIFEQARTILLNPKKRIAAEFREITAPHFDAYRLARTLDEFDISTVDRKFSALKVENIRRQINAAREKSKFPAVQDTSAIKFELKNLHDEFRRKIQDSFKHMNHDKCVLLANDFANAIVRTEGKFGIIVEDFFELYRLEMNPFLEETTEQINSLLDKIKSNVGKKFLDGLTANVVLFVSAKRPLDKFSIALGTNDFDDTEKIFYKIRNVAIKLFNEKDLIDEPLKITRMLEKNFSYLPPLAELIRKDIKFLEDTKARRPTQFFLDAKAALDKIQRELDKNLHFEKGFERANLIFYEKIFKAQLVFDLIRAINHKDFKPAELKELNAVAAVIYLHMGTALTWTRRADFAFDCFKKALPYAESSGDIKLISLAHKRVEEWEKINKQIAANSNDSSGCIWWIIIIVVLILLTR